MNRAKSRVNEFVLIYMGYMTFLAARKSYGFWLPSVLTTLQVSRGEAGVLGSSFEFVYGGCALLNGVLIDMASPKLLLVGGLLLSSCVCIGISMSSSLPVMVALWAFHGLVQSVGWPSVTNVFLAWFPDPATRGAWYSLLSTCQNAGAATVPLVLSFAMNYYGWKAALYVPAVSCVMMAMVLLLCLHGSPAAAQTYHGGARGLSREPSSNAVRRPPSVSLLINTVLFNKSLWLMGVNYFCISMVRTCLSDWSAVFLPESKGLSLPAAASALFFMETGGFVGSLAAGWISDRLFAGRRGPVVCICSSMIAPGLLGLRLVKAPLLIQACYFYIGFCAFPVHVLLGLFSREVVPPSVGSSAGGFVKCIAQAGGAFAGLPLGALQQRAGWDGVLCVLAGMGILSGCCALPLWGVVAGENKIMARNGSVADFANMQNSASSGGGLSGLSKKLA